MTHPVTQATRRIGAFLGAVCLAQAFAGPVAAEDVPTVTAEDLDALIKSHSGSAVVVNFWATWCPPCLREFPDIIAFYHEHHGDGVEVIAVSMNAPDEIEDIDEFLTRFAPPFPVYRAAAQDEAFYSGVLEGWYGEMPTTVIYDPSGQRAFVHKKPLTHEELVTDVLGLLRSEP